MNVQKLKGLMAENNHTQGYVAKYLKLSADGLRRKMQGKSDFKVTEVLALAKLYNVKPEIFLN